jgi:AraC-type DNA-binding domain-containing proteins
MYFTSLPDHTKPGFDEALHFSNFQKHNIIFNALSSRSHCDNHVGCLSFKTVLNGEEWYGIDKHRVAVRPGKFLILNNDQNYSCSIDHDEKVRVLSFFFQKEFAAAVFRDVLHSEETSLDTPFAPGEKPPEFFQTLYDITPELQLQLSSLISSLESSGYSNAMVDEHIVFLLHYLVRTHRSETTRIQSVNALKSSTKTEIYKRLCIARDVLHSSYMDQPDLQALSNLACLSVPQLVRQFKTVFQTTPHQYLIRIRLEHAAELLKQTQKPVHEITWMCGFENTSAFCRAFRAVYGVQPVTFRKLNR